MQYVYLAGFGLMGVFARFSLGAAVARTWVTTFPFGTFAINLVGSFLIGIVYVLGAERGLLSPELRVGVAVGFLGGFTTFSSYSLEVGRLVETGHSGIALLYFASSPVLGVAAALSGMAAMRFIVSMG